VAFVPVAADTIDPLHEGSLRPLDRLEFGLDASVEDLARDIAERIVSEFGVGWTECLRAGVRYATESYVVTALEGRGRRF
jgi:hypothetical protein